MRGSGHRAATHSGGWGGHREKSAAPDPEQWWFPGVAEVRSGAIAASIAKFNGEGGGG